MNNQLNFTDKMKDDIRLWKNKIFNSYTVNDETNSITKIKILVDNKGYIIENEYVLYQYPDNDCTELTCFSCVEEDKKVFDTTLVNGKTKKFCVEQKILGIHIVKDIESGKLFDTGIPYTLTFDTAIIIETEKCCYAFWRDIIFNTIEVALCENLQTALGKIRSANEIREEAQIHNPYTVDVKRTVEEL